MPNFHPERKYFKKKRSNLMLMTNLRSPGEAAALMKANLDLDLKSGQLILIIQD